jgi:type I restriction enzyme, S subunit
MFDLKERKVVNFDRQQELKSGWKWVKFGDVVKLSTARCNDPLAQGIERYVGLEHIDSDDLRIQRWGLVEDGITFTSLFKPGQVLFGKRRAYLRKVAVPDFAGVCSGDIYVFESANPQVLLPELLPFICQTDRFFEYAIGTSAGSLSPRTNWKNLVDFEFALPSMKEQLKLSIQFAALKEGIESLLFVNKRSDECRKSYLEKVFTDKYHKYCKLDQAAQIFSGGTPSKSRSDFWSGEIPWLSAKSMKTRFLYDIDDHISEEGLASSCKLIPANSIFIVVRGMILAHTFPVCRNLVPMAFNQDLKALIISPEYNPDYIHAWFDWAAPRYLQLISESSHGTKRLEMSQLLRLCIPDISLNLQHEILKPLNEIDNAHIAIDRRIVSLHSIKKNLLNLIEGAI